MKFQRAHLLNAQQTRSVIAGQLDGQRNHHTPRAYVRQAWGDDCGHGYLVAYCYKGCGVLPLCNTRRLAKTAAHLTDHVFPRLPARQWLLSAPNRLRYFRQRNGAAPNMVLQFFRGSPRKSLQTHCLGATPQAFCAPPVGDADRQNLRGVPAAVPDVRWKNASHHFCHRG